MHAEAQAALAAVEWASGKGESAEEHLEVAIRIEPRWDRMEYVRYISHLSTLPFGIFHAWSNRLLDFEFASQVCIGDHQTLTAPLSLPYTHTYKP